MRCILCYGDSNTWGYDPHWQARGKAYWRHAWEERWTGVLEAGLGSGYRVIEEGFGGRTLGADDPVSPFRNGRTYFSMLLESHQPLALVIILLGTNDTKAYLNREPEQIAADAGELIDIAKKSAAGEGGASPEVLLEAPPAQHPMVREGVFGGEFDASSLEKLLKLAPLLEREASRRGAHFMDAGVMADDGDGIHLDRDAQTALGRAVTARTAEILRAGV